MKEALVKGAVASIGMFALSYTFGYAQENIDDANLLHNAGVVAHCRNVPANAEYISRQTQECMDQTYTNRGNGFRSSLVRDKVTDHFPKDQPMTLLDTYVNDARLDGNSFDKAGLLSGSGASALVAGGITFAIVQLRRRARLGSTTVK